MDTEILSLSSLYEVDEIIAETERNKHMFKAILALSAFGIALANPGPVLLIAGICAIGTLAEKNERRRR